MDARLFLEKLQKIGIHFFTGVPDSLLHSFCSVLTENSSLRHIVAPNEGNALALAAGYYLAEGKPACVYLQNSGIGNLFNPVCSLTKIYDLPCLLIIGWRGEPGLPDEPQHLYQGSIMPDTLRLLGIPYIVLEDSTPENDFDQAFSAICEHLQACRLSAIVVKKNALTGGAALLHVHNALLREEALEQLMLSDGGHSLFVTSTGKISREFYELREKYRLPHHNDFLVVGSMGHASSLALSIALSRPAERIVCIDGDGALLMHMGALAMVGAAHPQNFVHILIDNGCHESVGGIPTVSRGIDFCAIARACGYETAMEVDDLPSLKARANQLFFEQRGLVFLRVMIAPGSRPGLGRPKHSPLENRTLFMERIAGKVNRG